MRISQILFPRLTVLITTTDGKQDNIATFSFVMPISQEPKCLLFATVSTHKTFENIQKINEFVINVPDKKLLKQTIQCGSVSGREKDKFKLTNLEKEKSVAVKPPRIMQCPIQVECKAEFLKEFGDHVIVVGKVVAEHINEEKLKTFQPILHKSRDEFFTSKKL